MSLRQEIRVDVGFANSRRLKLADPLSGGFLPECSEM